MNVLLLIRNLIFINDDFKNEQIWHEARTKYTRSSAVNSMVGHILGIGDRHSHNILVHQKTGEVVHIDFGIVYEQGKVRYILGLTYSTNHGTNERFVSSCF